ncbi:hypothetical protein XBJ2_1060011 [Xenorhabdus bovienii str. Jollieti]|uniref:Uncharacterized protein n=1 Tax=Xenorhabdus bovienii (strain SS-2004) TaxID=406818 RepID=D3V326_XENBS|nr:hypothetical protein [Xenorhabdus bovienii]CBJ81141.1 hypothetical protein XBJ1_2015 [Xenorhabdus bovienii SS-2004]CDH26984.1 hypothetical protein XBJ2_1060011 [Xenorhabdus bovienii str. Jollieti]
MNNKLQAAVEIAEEIEASIFPVVTAIQNEAEPDTYLMCRGVHRQTCDLAQRLRDINKEYIMEGVIDTCSNLDIELEPAKNAIEKLRSLLSTMIDVRGDDDDANLLLIAIDLAFDAGKEIARVRGVEYS